MVERADRISPDGKWSAIQILFDDGTYTVISGVYGDSSTKRLAQRCNGPSVPETHRYPIGWHVVPEFLEIPLLCALLDELWKNPRQLTNAGKDRGELVLEEIQFFHRQKGQQPQER